MKNRKGFTLIEMLIVIVIVGILAAALIPRLVGVQERARDTARRADLQQIGGAISTYELDNGGFPTNENGESLVGSTSNETFVDALSSYLKSMPNDPKNINIDVCGITDGGYYFTPITKNGNTNGAFALIAAVEQPGAANYIATECIGQEMTYSTIQDNLCERVIDGSQRTTEGEENCVRDGTSQLRYVYIP